MDLSKYLAVLVVFLVEGGESGGHGGKHHDHVRLHVPEFIHHDRHTNVITIHHHHHKPKEKHHHHHHHHHHKPHISHGHHYHHVKKVHHKKTESSGHHGNHGHHGHHGHHGYHGHHGHHHKHHGPHGHHGGHHHHDSPAWYPHHDAPSISSDPTPSSFEDDFGEHFSPAVPAYGAGIVPRTPHVHGVTHTVKQVKVFDSLPNGIPSITNGHAAGGGYQVTEEAEDEDDAFTAIDGLQQSYPATFAYVRGAAAEPVSNDVFSSFPPQSTVQSVSHDPFAESPAPTAFSGNDFTSPAQAPLSSLGLTEHVIPSAQSTPEFPVTFQAAQTGFDDPANAFAGAQAGSTAAALSPEDKAVNDIVSYSRAAGIQQTINTGGVESVVY